MAESTVKGACTIKPAGDFITHVHGVSDSNELVSGAAEAQQALEYVARKISREHAGQYRGSRNYKGAAGPPDMQPFVRRLLTRRAFPDALDADGRRR